MNQQNRLNPKNNLNPKAGTNQKSLNRFGTKNAANQSGKALKNNLILCGFMGSGKSTVGRLLARRLHRPFVDLDEFIEQQTGQTVAEIFNTRGEGAFRALEREAARSLCSQSGLVLSCGGGTVLNPQTAALLKQSGTVIYLKVLPQTVLQRLKGNRTRPLLQGTETEKKNRITALLAEREPFYKAAAEFTVSTNQGAEPAVLEILQQTGLG